MASKGFIYTAYGIDHEPLKGYKTLFAFTVADARARFQREYGRGSEILYLVPDTFSQWDDLQALAL